MSSSSSFEDISQPNSPGDYTLQPATEVKLSFNPPIPVVAAPKDSLGSGADASLSFTAAKQPTNTQPAPFSVSYRSDANVPAPQVPTTVKAGVTFQPAYKTGQASAEPSTFSLGLAGRPQPSSQIQTPPVYSPPSAEASKLSQVEYTNLSASGFQPKSDNPSFGHSAYQPAPANPSGTNPSYNPKPVTGPSVQFQYSSLQQPGVNPPPSASQPKPFEANPPVYSAQAKSYDPSAYPVQANPPSSAQAKLYEANPPPAQAQPSPYQYSYAAPGVNHSVKSDIPLGNSNVGALAIEKKDDDHKSDEPDNDEKFLCLKIKIWLFIFLGLMAFLFILIIGCLATPRWAYQGDDDLEIIGGLLTCSDCPGTLDGETYADIMEDDDYCDNEFFDGLCDTITKLQHAGGAYLAFSIFTIVVLLFWTAFFILNIFKKKIPGPKWLPYLLPALALLLNFLAIASWGGASEAKFKDKDECDVLSLTDDEDICATDGPGLALFIYLYLILYSVLFAVFYFMTSRRKQAEGSDNTSSKALNEAPKNDDRV
eukprot:CAMPEP_0204904138 /NCGR_PEP_ID=MMETSP1397-20131031/4686_1 /ASSEMBLY_ACC=CAM_ASM_000891 /TAXON_ID=49980 /ORGANISM="Climacostomum Climacostomum virens, Strain Stock W-24" /LENGTH=537 /DNA_ID=CAMNT_0052072883 /DNA_START=69 /DNA_END=1682 /DNA_ORIENTATION=-